MKVFISYRRETGSMLARYMQSELEKRGHTVFLDYDGLGSSGGFNDQLLHAIEAADHFLLVLSAHALDRCCEANDWVRREIAHALRHGKNIVPIKTADFSFPALLPQEIEQIRLRHAPTYSDEYARAFVEKVCGMMAEQSPAEKLSLPPEPARKEAPKGLLKSIWGDYVKTLRGVFEESSSGGPTSS